MYKWMILIFLVFFYSCASPNTDTICDDNPCRDINRTICSPSGSSYTCACDVGYKDKHGVCIKDAEQDPCYPNPCADSNRNICNSDNDMPICLCNSGFHDENSVCVANVKILTCKNNETLPKDSHELVTDIEVTYENNQWGEIPFCEIECNEGFNKNDNNECISSEEDPCDHITCGDNSSCDAGNCLCDSGFHKEAEFCKANKKMMDCNDNSPANSVKVDASVEIIYTEGAGWSIPVDCEWNCNDNFHKEGNACVENALTCEPNEHEENGACASNSKTVNCSDNTPDDATKVVAMVEINYTSDNGWSIPVDCEWNCNPSFHKESNSCSSNTKMIDCDDSSLPDNAIKVDALVEITYTEGAGWSIPSSCSWNCESDFHKEVNECLSNTKTIACNENTPANAVTVSGDVEITYSNGTWSNPADCDFNCNAGYHQEENLCVEDVLVCGDTEHEEDGECVNNTKMLDCNDNTPLNATKVNAQVEVTYTQENGWSVPANCSWNCNTDYHEESGACVEDGGISCDDSFESNNTYENAKLIIDANSRGPQYTDLTICENDEDWYKIESEENSGLEIDVNYTHVSNECDIDLKLYKMVNNVLTQVDTSGGFSGLETVYVRSTVNAETYYLKVYGYKSNCENPYKLTANIFNNCIDDEEGASVSEQDDTLEEAVSFSLNTEYNRMICDYDDDWYGYYFNAGDSIKITLDLVNNNGDLDIFLYDADKNSLEGTYGTLDKEIINYDITADGNYFIKVRGWNANGQNSYTLKVVKKEIVFNSGDINLALLDDACKIFEADFSDQVDSTTATISSLKLNKLLIPHEYLSDVSIFIAIGDEEYTEIWETPSELSRNDNNRDDDAENDADIDLINRNYASFNGNSLGDKKFRLKVCDNYPEDEGTLNKLYFTIKYSE